MSDQPNFITEVAITLKDRKESKLLASGSFKTKEGWEINFRVVESSRGLFIGLPSNSYKKADGTVGWTQEVRIEDEIVFRYVQKHLLERFKEAQGKAVKEAQVETVDDTATAEKPSPTTSPNSEDEPF